MKKQNGIIIGLLAGVMAVLLVFTYISMQVYRHSLPVVETGEITSGTIKRTYTMEGIFRYQKTQEVLLPVPVVVEKIYVRAGEAVSEGMEILKLDSEYLHIQMLELELLLEGLREQEKEETDSRKSEIIAYTRKEKEAEYQKLQELYEAEGILYAACRGEVRGVYTKETAKEPAGKLIVSICDKSGGAEISWNMKEEGILFERFYAEVRLIDGQGVETATLILDNMTKSYDSVTDTVSYTAEVPEQGKKSAMHDAEMLTVSAYYVSEVYPALIPVSAVTYEADGTISVYELKSRPKSFGTEYYVRKQSIQVLDKDGDYVAISSSMKDSRLIKNSSKPLYDRATVWVEF